MNKPLTTKTAIFFSIPQVALAFALGFLANSDSTVKNNFTDDQVALNSAKIERIITRLDGIQEKDYSHNTSSNIAKSVTQSLAKKGVESVNSTDLTEIYSRLAAVENNLSFRDNQVHDIASENFIPEEVDSHEVTDLVGSFDMDSGNTVSEDLKLEFEDQEISSAINNSSMECNSGACRVNATVSGVSLIDAAKELRKALVASGYDMSNGYSVQFDGDNLQAYF